MSVALGVLVTLGGQTALRGIGQPCRLGGPVGDDDQIGTQELAGLQRERLAHPVDEEAHRGDCGRGHHQRRQQQPELAGAPVASQELPGQRQPPRPTRRGSAGCTRDDRRQGVLGGWRQGRGSAGEGRERNYHPGTRPVRR